MPEIVKKKRNLPKKNARTRILKQSNIQAHVQS